VEISPSFFLTAVGGRGKRERERGKSVGRNWAAGQNCFGTYTHQGARGFRGGKQTAGEAQSITKDEDWLQRL